MSPRQNGASRVEPYPLGPGVIPPTIGEVIAVAARMSGVQVDDITGPSRRGEVLTARHIAIHAIRRLTGASWSDIARRLGKDHSSVMSAGARVEVTEHLKARSDLLIATILREELPGPSTTVEILVDALRSIGTDCQSYRLPSTCIDAGRTRGARYGADRWCDGCVARDALDQAGIR